MERLTIKNNDGSYSQPTKTTFEQLFYKVAELEDFMEEFGLNNIGELKLWAEWFNFLQRIMKENSIDNIADLQSYFKENNDLKTRWDELKEEVYDKCEYYGDLVEDDCVTEYAKGKNKIIKEIYDKIEELEKIQGNL